MREEYGSPYPGFLDTDPVVEVALYNDNNIEVSVMCNEKEWDQRYTSKEGEKFRDVINATRSEKTKEEYDRRSEERFNDNQRESGVSEEEVSGKRRGSESNQSDSRGQDQKGQLDGRPGNGFEPHVQPFRDGYGFHECLERGRHNKKWGCCVDNHNAEELADMKLFLSSDNNYGIAVEKDGNICCAFNGGSTPNVVPVLLDTAKKNGGTKMDCYGRVLVNMYEQNGFKPVARIPFNADYVDKTEFNKPLLESKFDVYALCLSDEPTHISTQEELDNLPTFEDYDEALRYRDEILSKISQ